MLPLHFRLRTRREFTNVYIKGKVVRGKYLTIRFLKKGDNKKTRFGFAPARKIGKAVLKNEVKRRVREICRYYVDFFQDGYDIVINIKQDVVSTPYEELKGDFLDICRRARLLLGDFKRSRNEI